ncbi:MarR family transcriptional regulator [Tolypothrix bouteillei VB521301_2]|uniref:MarR family transcriptional regulator n=1 Tax=Tolypothrix bouteillei TaxID=1246981 RepID=UPI000679A368
MTQQAYSKIQGKFYPLQHEEWLKACRELTPAQRDVLYYIRTIDPRNYGIEINSAEIARQLSSLEHTVHRQTVSRALKELDAKGFIDLELLQVKAKVKPKGLWCDDAPRCDDAPQAIVTHRDRSPRTASDRHAPRSIATHQAKPESVRDKRSQHAKSIKEIKESIESLSDLPKQEREDFKKFVRQEYKRIEGKEIRHINAFLQGEYFQEWYHSYQNRPEAHAVAQADKWANHPHYSEWLAEIERTKNPFEFAGSDKEKQSFIDWCWETKQYSWLKEEDGNNGL